MGSMVSQGQTGVRSRRIHIAGLMSRQIIRACISNSILGRTHLHVKCGSPGAVDSPTTSHDMCNPRSLAHCLTTSSLSLASPQLSSRHSIVGAMPFLERSCVDSTELRTQGQGHGRVNKLRRTIVRQLLRVGAVSRFSGRRKQIWTQVSRAHPQA